MKKLILSFTCLIFTVSTYASVDWVEKALETGQEVVLKNKKGAAFTDIKFLSKTEGLFVAGPGSSKFSYTTEGREVLMTFDETMASVGYIDGNEVIVEDLSAVIYLTDKGNYKIQYTSRETTKTYIDGTESETVKVVVGDEIKLESAKLKGLSVSEFGQDMVYISLPYGEDFNGAGIFSLESTQELRAVEVSTSEMISDGDLLDVSQRNMPEVSKSNALALSTDGLDLVIYRIKSQDGLKWVYGRVYKNGNFVINWTGPILTYKDVNPYTSFDTVAGSYDASKTPGISGLVYNVNADGSFNFTDENGEDSPLQPAEITEDGLLKAVRIRAHRDSDTQMGDQLMLNSAKTRADIDAVCDIPNKCEDSYFRTYAWLKVPNKNGDVLLRTFHSPDRGDGVMPKTLSLWIWDKVK